MDQDADEDPATETETEDADEEDADEDEDEDEEDERDGALDAEDADPAPGDDAPLTDPGACGVTGAAGATVGPAVPAALRSAFQYEGVSYPARHSARPFK